MMISRISTSMVLASLVWAATTSAAGAAQAVAPPDPSVRDTSAGESGDVYLPGSGPAAVTPPASGNGVLATVLSLGLADPGASTMNSGRISNQNGRINGSMTDAPGPHPRQTTPNQRG